MPTIKPIIFKLSGEEYGIDISMVNAIEQVQKIVKVPNAPGYIKGIINLRGEVVPVYSLRKKFDMEDNVDGEAKLIITNIDQMQIAIEVDEVSEITDVNEVDVNETPPIVMGKGTEYIDSIAKIEGNMVIMIDTKKLMSGEEQAGVREFMDNQK